MTELALAVDELVIHDDPGIQLRAGCVGPIFFFFLHKSPAELKPQNKWFCEPTYIKLKGTENH